MYSRSLNASRRRTSAQTVFDAGPDALPALPGRWRVWLGCALVCGLLVSAGNNVGATSAHTPTHADWTRTVPPRDDPGALQAAIAELARELLDSAIAIDLRDRLQLALAAERIDDAITILKQLDGDRAGATRPPLVFAYGLYADALSARGIDFESGYKAAFEAGFCKLTDREAFERVWWLETPGFVFSSRLDRAWADIGDADTMNRAQALTLVKAWLGVHLNQLTGPLVPPLVRQDQERRYVIDERVVIRAEDDDGPTLSAIIARPRSGSERLPTALIFTIYADPAANLARALTAASYGYVGIVAHSRGKYLSDDEIRPYEHEVEDTHRVLDWIVKQPWSNGGVGMYGASYEGFAAWAALKRPHSALKTIVTSAAAIPGQGLPMTNNVFLNANYGWTFFVGSDSLLDHATYGDRERWDRLFQQWYESGRPYRELDLVDGTPNPHLQRWLDHPSYDEYWRAMVPYAEEFARIEIPILSITGYYDDGQISALQYVREHLRYLPEAEHYLVIGPYDHFGASGIRKSQVLRGYHIDPVAHFNTQELTFEWFNYIFAGGRKPALLQDRINYQVMGSNRWRHVHAMEGTSVEQRKFFLVPSEEGRHHHLSRAGSETASSLLQSVDLTDRTIEHNDYYPDPVLGREPGFETGIVYVSEAFGEPIEFSGQFSGRLDITINKRDVDLGAVLYEQLADGTLLHLAYWLGRASYSGDPKTRRLLSPGKQESVAIGPTTFVSRQIGVGSRLLLVVDVNVNPWHQINYGSGIDVSEESVLDAGDPLEIRWHDTSHILLPINVPAEASSRETAERR